MLRGGGEGSSNDGFDAATGVDKNKAESVVNLTGGRAGPILAVSFALLAVGAWLLYLGFSPAVQNQPLICVRVDFAARVFGLWQFGDSLMIDAFIAKLHPKIWNVLLWNSGTGNVTLFLECTLPLEHGVWVGVVLPMHGVPASNSARAVLREG